MMSYDAIILSRLFSDIQAARIDILGYLPLRSGETFAPAANCHQPVAVCVLPVVCGTIGVDVEIPACYK